MGPTAGAGLAASLFRSTRQFTSGAGVGLLFGRRWRDRRRADGRRSALVAAPVASRRRHDAGGAGDRLGEGSTQPGPPTDSETPCGLELAAGAGDWRDA